MDKEEKLIVDNMGLVYKQLHRFKRAYDADAFSFAMEALMNAARTYDSKQNTAFSTYATVCIYNAIGNYLRHLNKKNQIHTVSYNELLSEDGNGTFEYVLGTGQNPEDEIVANERYKVLLKAFDELLNDSSNDTVRLIIEYWRDSDFTASQTDIARATGLTQSHVSRTLSAFRHKLKQKLEEWQ